MSDQPPAPPPYSPPPVPPAAPPPAPPPGQPPGQPPGPPMAPPPSGPPTGGLDAEVKSAEQKALWGLILGIANFVCCNLLFIGALILGNQALAVLDRPGVQSGSRGLAVAARVLGIIGIFWLVLGVIGGIIYALVIAGAAASGGFHQ